MFATLKLCFNVEPKFIYKTIGHKKLTSRCFAQKRAMVSLQEKFFSCNAFSLMRAFTLMKNDTLFVLQDDCKVEGSDFQLKQLKLPLLLSAEGLIGRNFSIPRNRATFGKRCNHLSCIHISFYDCYSRNLVFFAVCWLQTFQRDIGLDFSVIFSLMCLCFFSF